MRAWVRACVCVHYGNKFIQLQLATCFAWTEIRQKNYSPQQLTSSSSGNNSGSREIILLLFVCRRCCIFAYVLRLFHTNVRVFSLLTILIHWLIVLAALVACWSSNCTLISHQSCDAIDCCLWTNSGVSWRMLTNSLLSLNSSANVKVQTNVRVLPHL